MSRRWRSSLRLRNARSLNEHVLPATIIMFGVNGSRTLGRIGPVQRLMPDHGYQCMHGTGWGDTYKAE